MTEISFPTHEEIRSDLAEYALGVLDGRSRAVVMAHVESCDECAETVRELATTLEEIYQLPPNVDPPVGFESRVFARMGVDDTHLVVSRRPRMTWIAAVAAAAAVVFALGWGSHHLSGTNAVASGTFSQRALVSGVNKGGEVYAYNGPHAWMFVSLAVGRGLTVLNCRVVTTSGQSIYVGHFAVTSGHAAWAVTLPVALSSVRTVQLTSFSGQPVAHLASGGWRAPTTNRANYPISRA